MSIKFVPRRSDERGNADHGWLKTFHTFSFAGYQEDGHDHFGCGHREFEIFSYVVSGELEHGDSMGNQEILKRGNLQMTSAGTGIRHSEKAHGSKPVHFLQIWSVPSQSGLPPQYFTRHFSDEEKRDKWAQIVAPLSLYASLISPSITLSHTLPAASKTSQRKAYIHVVQTSGYNPGKAAGAHVKVGGADGESVELREGDGSYIMIDAGSTMEVQNIGDKVAEVLLFDVE